MAIGRFQLRWATLALVGIALVATVVAGQAFDPLSAVASGSAGTGGAGVDDDSTAASGPRERAEITTQSLTSTIEADGEVVHAEHRPILAFGPGTLTDLVTTGTPVEAGTVLFEIDESPVVSLIGQVPAWRDLAVGDEGVDVEQLEANLSALGYDPGGLLSVDTTFTGYTATVVERWQTDLGVDTTGSIALGSVAFVPGDGRVISTLAAEGDTTSPTGSTALTVSPEGQEIVFEVAAEDLDTIGPGTEVEARLPDRTVLVAEVSTVAPAGDGTWWATAVPDGDSGQVEVPDGEAVPVSVSWTHTLSASTSVVRANALTRLDGGRYVVEVVDSGDDGQGGEGAGPSTRFVEVGIGVRSGSMVEIITDLRPGTVVIAP